MFLSGRERPIERPHDAERGRQMTPDAKMHPARWSQRLLVATLAALRKTVGRVFWVERVAFYGADIAVNQNGLIPPQGIAFVAPTADELLTSYGEPLEANFRLPLKEVRKRLSKSHTVVLAVCGSAPIAMVWLAFEEQKVSEIGRMLVLRPHEVLTYNEFTLPAWRGRGVSPALNRFADDFAARRNAVRRITWRRVSNAPAIRVAEKLGHRRLAVATTVRLANHSYPIVLGLDAAEPQLMFRRL